MTESDINRDDALMWLNDRRGQEVHINVMVDCGGYSATLFEAIDELRHWRDVVPEVAKLDPSGRREDIEGSYHVGDAARLDISDPDLPGGFRLRRVSVPEMDLESECLVIELSDGVEINIYPRKPGGVA